MKKKHFDVGTDGFYGAYWKCKSDSDCAMIAMIGDDSEDYLARISVKWLHKLGVKVTGATVHFVDEVLDNGPIILQKAVMIEEGDTPEVLQRRVMEQAEWVILPKAIDLIANGKISVENGIAHIKE